jgi:DNA excision repair protein ERCC-4
MPNHQPSTQEVKQQLLLRSTNNISSTIQSKIVLLTFTFPRLRIIWSSSPYASADIFNDLKANNAEPDPTKAIAVGAEDDPDVGAGINAAAEELLRCLPGITTKNVKYLISKVKNVRELCSLSLTKVQEALGVEPGWACFDFMHKGDFFTEIVASYSR